MKALETLERALHIAPTSTASRLEAVAERAARVVEARAATDARERVCSGCWLACGQPPMLDDPETEARLLAGARDTLRDFCAESLASGSCETGRWWIASLRAVLGGTTRASPPASAATPDITSRPASCADGPDSRCAL